MTIADRLRAIEEEAPRRLEEYHFPGLVAELAAIRAEVEAVASGLRHLANPAEMADRMAKEGE